MITTNGFSYRVLLQNSLLAIWILLLLCISTAFAQKRTPAGKTSGESLNFIEKYQISSEDYFIKFLTNS